MHAPGQVDRMRRIGVTAQALAAAAVALAEKVVGAVPAPRCMVRAGQALQPVVGSTAIFGTVTMERLGV